LLKALNHFPIHPIWRTSNWWMLMTNSKKIKCPTSPVGEVSDLELKYVGEVRYIGYRVLSWFMVRFVLLFIVLFRLFEFFCFIVSCFDSCYSFLKSMRRVGWQFRIIPLKLTLMIYVRIILTGFWLGSGYENMNRQITFL
jgi:hypothetical protein